MPTITSPKLTVDSMQWQSRQPSNLNYLRANGFLFMVQNLPKVSYFCQVANVPTINLGVARQPTPFVDIPHPGEKLQFGELVLRFKVQENLENFMEIFTWFVGLGFPVSRDQFKNYVSGQAFRYPQINAEGPQLSDATLLVLDANNNPSAQFNFVDCFPTSLSDMNFDISSGEAQYFQSTVSFAYSYYTVESLVTS